MNRPNRDMNGAGKKTGIPKQQKLIRIEQALIFSQIKNYGQLQSWYAAPIGTSPTVPQVKVGSGVKKDGLGKIQ